MLDARAEYACCDRCAGAGTAARIARPRLLLKAAVFRPADPDGGSPGTPAGFATSGELPRAITGTIIDVSPHFLVVSHGAGQQRLALTPDAAAWRAGRLTQRRCGPATWWWRGCIRPPAALPTGSGRTSAG